MSLPVIKTAIPERRYQLGEFLVSVLGQVQSGDGVDYRYIMAVAREQEGRPRLFVSAERNLDAEAGEGAWALRVSMPDGSQVVGASDRWADVETFSREGLAIVQKLLSLEDEVPYPLT